MEPAMPPSGHVMQAALRQVVTACHSFLRVVATVDLCALRVLQWYYHQQNHTSITSTLSGPARQAASPVRPCPASFSGTLGSQQLETHLAYSANLKECPEEEGITHHKGPEPQRVRYSGSVTR